MQTLTGYKPSELKDCVAAIHHMQLNRKYSSMMAIREKYKQHKVSMGLDSRTWFYFQIVCIIQCPNCGINLLKQFKAVSALLPPVEIPASYFIKKLKE
jgi:cyclin A